MREVVDPLYGFTAPYCLSIGTGDTWKESNYKVHYTLCMRTEIIRQRYLW